MRTHHGQEPPPNTAGPGRDFWLNSQWGSPEPLRGVVAVIIIFLLRTEKKERLKNMGDNSPTQLSCPQRLEPTKSVAAFGDMAVIESGLGQDSHDMGWPAVLQGPPL